MNEEVLSGNNFKDGVEQALDIVVSKEEWVEKAIQREATPQKLRKETVEEFAKKYNIDPSTYYYNVRKKENKKRIVEIWLNEALDGGQEVLEKLRENAKSGKEKSIEMYMKFVLELAENLDIKSNGRPIIQIVNQIAQKYETPPTPSEDSRG